MFEQLSPGEVEVGTELAKKNGLANLEYRLGDIEQVPPMVSAVKVGVVRSSRTDSGRVSEASIAPDLLFLNFFCKLAKKFCR